MSDMPTADSRFAEPIFDAGKSSCYSCRFRDYGRTSCAAFPDGIPRAILDGDNRHIAPFPGDNGITYRRSPYRDTDGALTATFVASRGGYQAALWVGDDGTIGALAVPGEEGTWAGHIMGALSHGYESAEIFGWWLDGAFNASVPLRFSTMDELQAAHAARVVSDTQ